MTCHEFQRGWDELLDADGRASGASGATPAGPGRPPADDEAEAALLAHAAKCPACRPVAARYQVLRQAVWAWRCPPSPPSGLVSRVLSTPIDLPFETTPSVGDRVRRLWRENRGQVNRVAGLAATVMAGMGLAMFLHQVQPRDVNGRAHQVAQTAVDDLHSIRNAQPAPVDSRDLNRALADATSATLDLARSASEPAARISREMLDATGQISGPAGDGATGPDRGSPADRDDTVARVWVPVPSLEPLSTDGVAASAVIQQVGDQLSAGVEPLSSSARHAFGFLLGAPTARAGPRDVRPTSRGA